MGTPYRSKSNMDFGKGTNRVKNGPTLTEKQKALDKNNNNKIDAQDFKMINNKSGAPNMKDGVYKQGFEKNGPTLMQDKTNVELSKHEKEKGTMVTGGSKSEEKNDLEDRIEFLNNDISEESSVMKKGKMITQRNKLKAQLKKLTTT